MYIRNFFGISAGYDNFVANNFINLWEKLKDITRKRTLKPFFLVTFQFFIVQFCGIFAMRPFIVQILEAHGIPWDANKTTVVLGLLGILANAVLLMTVKIWGKRNIYLWSMVFTVVSCFGLSKRSRFK